MKNTFQYSRVLDKLRIVQPPKELRHLKAVCQLQESFQYTTPASKFYKNNFGILVSCERVRKTTSQWSFGPTSMRKYNDALEDFQKHQFLNVVENGQLVRKTIGDTYELIGMKESYKIEKILHSLPYDGATGVILKYNGRYKDKYVICFRSAIETSSFMKIGLSGLGESAYPWSSKATANQFLSSLYIEEYAPIIREAVLNNWRPASEILFLGFSMGAALAQLSMYDLFVDQKLECQSSHLLLASPRVANDAFYKELASSSTQTRVCNFIAAANFKDIVYMDPIPLMSNFRDPPQIYILGNLSQSCTKWHEQLLDPTLAFDTIFPIQIFKMRPEVHNTYTCSCIATLGTFIGSMLTGTSIDIHNLAYFNAANYCVIQRPSASTT